MSSVSSEPPIDFLARESYSDEYRASRLKLALVPRADTQHCAKDPPAGTGHCPLMRNRADLDAEFALSKREGADGLIVW